MRTWLVALVVVTAFGVGGAIADEVVETTDGRQVLLRIDGTYEILEAARSPAAANYQRMSISDLKLDIEDLAGANVEVDVQLMSMGGMLMLSDPRHMFDSNPLMAEEGDLSREERSHILSRCNQGCRITIRGEVASVLFQSGVRLHELVR